MSIRKEERRNVRLLRAFITYIVYKCHKLTSLVKMFIEYIVCNRQVNAMPF